MLHRSDFSKEIKFYHFNQKCLHLSWFNVPALEVWHLFSQVFIKLKQENKMIVHGFVMLENHFHILYSSSARSEITIRYLQDQFEEHFKLRFQVNGPILDSDFMNKEILSLAQYKQTYKYIYRNPVDAKICQNPQEYRFSTLGELLGLQEKIIPAVDYLDLIYRPQIMLNWLSSS